MKKQRTLQQERSVLKGWAKHLRYVRLNQIRPKHINDYVLKRRSFFGVRAGGRDKLGENLSARTINLDVVILRNCLKFAKQEGWLRDDLPTEGWKPLAYRAKKRELLTRDQLDLLCSTALQTNEDGSPRFLNGDLLVDALRFMAVSGARVTSALSTLWEDVDWEKRQLHLRNTKYGKQNVVVDFNPELEALLNEMRARRLPDTSAMFPSNRSDGSVRSLRKTFEKVRQAAGLERFGFHDLRHYFISWCVMSQVDFMTIARWVGHEDGGILIGKIYGHLSNQHLKNQAKKVSFGDSSVGRLVDPVSQEQIQISKREWIQFFKELTDKLAEAKKSSNL